MKTTHSKKQINFMKFQHKPIKFLFFVARQEIRFGVAAVFCVILAGLFQTSIHPIIKNIINSISDFDGNEQKIYFLFALFLAAMTMMNLLYRLSGFFASWWVTFMETFSAQIVFDYVLGHSAQYFSSRLSGKLQSKIFNIANAASAIFPILLWNFLSLLVKLVALTVLAFLAHPGIGAIFIIFITISILFNAIMSRKMSVYSKEKSERGSETKGIMVDIISNVLAVKQNVATRRESQKVGNVLASYRKAKLRGWRYFDVILLFNNILIIAMFGAIMVVAIHFWLQGLVSVGDVVMLLTMLLTLHGSLEFLSESFNRFMEHLGQMKEGLEEIFMDHGIIDSKNAKKTKITRGKIIFENVDFQYKKEKGQTVFNNLSLTIQPGEKIGLVGESGEGKSTFVSLLLRFMDVENGTISIDGHDICLLRQDDLRNAIAYVPQEALLFHRTLEENIKYSNPATAKEDLIRASRHAHSFDFISKFPKGFKTMVGERGIKLSGGQKQRVMIARAMLKKSPIIVLDEATSSLDSRSEKLIQEALGELMKNRTTIVIAHRLSTLKKMDRIIVFKNGKIVEDGAHDELITKKGQYLKLWKYQSGKLD